jgi:hypothetical protein
VARRVFLHVGTLKTGTTYLQRVLWENRDALRRAGLLPAGKHWSDRMWAAQVLRGKPQAGHRDRAWTRIVRQSHRFPGDLVISHEFFGAADEAMVRRVLADLAHTEVHVVVTARNLAALVPAFWQERLKYGRSDPLAGFEPAGYDADVLDHWSWRTIDAADVLRRWAADLPPERVHVVTFPPAGSPRDELWRRFATVCGVDPAVAVADVPGANVSLGVAQAELLRRVVEDLPPELDRKRYRWLRRFLGEEVLGPRSTERLTAPPEMVERLRSRSAGIVATLRDAGYDVVGDLDDLLDPDEPGTGRQPEEVPDAELLEVSVQAVRDLVVRYRAAVLEAEGLRSDLAQARRALGETPPEG